MTPTSDDRARLQAALPKGTRMRAMPFGEAVAGGEAAVAELSERPARIALVLAESQDILAQAALGILGALADAGDAIPDGPDDAAELLARLGGRRPAFAESLLLPDYLAFFHALPGAFQVGVADRWGAAEQDPRFRAGELHCGTFALPVTRCGRVAIVAAAPTSNIPPRHGELAVHAWLQDVFRADAAFLLEMSQP